MLLQTGDVLFMERSESAIKTLASNPLFVIPATAQMVLNFWSISLLVIGLGTAQRLPVGKALLNLLIAIMIASLLFLPIKWLWDHGF